MSSPKQIYPAAILLVTHAVKHKYLRELQARAPDSRTSDAPAIISSRLAQSRVVMEGSNASHSGEDISQPLTNCSVETEFNNDWPCFWTYTSYPHDHCNQPFMTPNSLYYHVLDQHMLALAASGTYICRWRENEATQACGYVPSACDGDLWLVFRDFEIHMRRHCCADDDSWIFTPFDWSESDERTGVWIPRRE